MSMGIVMNAEPNHIAIITKDTALDVTIYGTNGGECIDASSLICQSGLKLCVNSEQSIRFVQLHSNKRHF